MKETGKNGFQSKVVKQLEKQTAVTMNFHGHMMQKSGWPDLEVLHKRWKGFLELKCEKRKATPLQRDFAKKIKLRGATAYVLRCVERDKHDMCLDFKIQYIYTLENFYGDVIETFDDLRSLLDILVRLELDKDWRTELKQALKFAKESYNADEIITWIEKELREG